MLEYGPFVESGQKWALTNENGSKVNAVVGALALQMNQTRMRIRFRSRDWNRKPPNRAILPVMDALDFLFRDAVLATIVEFCGTHIGMARHVLGVLERGAVLEIGRDAGAAHQVRAKEVRG